MRLDRRFVIVVGLSLVWALVVSLVFYRAASRSGKKTPWKPERPVVLAVEALPIGAVIRPESVKIGRVPENLFPRGGFSRVEEVVDRPVMSPIQPDEAVVEARLAVKGSGGGVAPLIPPGMRAISVRVNDVVGVAGFVLPGMRVDVLVTGRPPGRDDMVTTTVLQNIAVLSAGKTIQVDSKSQSISTPVVTLLVTPEQAESLTLANSEGRIQLVLRNSTDQGAAQTKGRDLRQLYPGWGPARPAAVETPQEARTEAPAAPHTPAAGAPPPVPETERVLMIRGSQKTEEAIGDLTPARPKQDEAARSADAKERPQ
ncbi:MAG TPA: Flp pilus assembly protein CpaB [Bryobacteraceae bacterium]|nr:Flp pilus assembly protein CpaB [Bryobacteraceae bacterium]